jgi:hypothetical protein
LCLLLFSFEASTWAATERSAQALWFAKTSAGTKNGTVLGKVGPSTKLASTQLENFGGGNPYARAAGT